MSNQSNLGRRSFLRGALAVTAGAALPVFALSGCAKQEPSLPSGTPMSEEQRLASISDPAYMGASTNYAGQEVVIGTGKKGQIANQAMIDHHSIYDPHMEKVTDRIYVAIGNSLCNSILIIGDDGIIVVDTGECTEGAARDLEFYRTVTDLPVTAVIYTHSHYANGTQAYIPAGNPENVPVIAQERFMEALLSPLTEKSGFYVARAQRMLGNYMEMEGPDGSVGCGGGPYYVNPTIENPTGGFIPPNTLIPFDVPMTEMSVAGLTLRFYPSVADDVANINIYVVEEDTLITNQVWNIFWNMYTLRGDLYREPTSSVKNIDFLIGLEPENVVSVCGLPLMGREQAKTEMTRYRDGVQYVYDQTIRLMNKGYDPEQIVEAFEIPTFLIEGFYNKPIYGEIEHYVRGVYSGLVGWFGTDPIELHPVSKAFESGKIVEAMGGADSVVAEAKRVLEDRQYAWAATLATYVLNIDSEHESARAVKGEACRKMAQVTQATNTRHWCMTAALELEGKLDTSKAAAIVTKEKLAAAPRALLLDMLRVSIDPSKAKDVEGSFAVTYTDENVSTSMILRNCVGQVIDGRVDSPDAELKLTYPTLLSIIVKEKSLQECLDSGEAVVEGSADALNRIFDVFEMQL